MKVSDCLAARARKATPIRFAPADKYGDWLKAQPKAVQAACAANGLSGGLGEVLALSDDGAGQPLVIIGAGRGDDPFSIAAGAERLPAGVYALEKAPPKKLAGAMALAWALGAYRFKRYKSKERDVAKLVAPAGADLARVSRLAQSAYLVRDLVNTPPNDMGPDELEAAAAALASDYDAKLKVVAGDQLLKKGYPLVHAVGRAADRAPRLIDLRWGRSGARKVTLVGKGVCFDTGGVNMKTAGGMKIMKKDMGGAAHVLGVARAVMDAGWDVDLRVLVPAVVNAVSSSAYLPGDVYPARNGLTVEISNTDAEGRLVLADALAAASEDRPDVVIVMATLTGAARIAVGPEIAPFYSPDDKLAQAVAKAGDQEFDPVWRMPLWRGYEGMLESKVADVNHCSDNPMAGSVTAALFLSRFIENVPSWAHFDLYAWNQKPRLGRPVGGEAQAVRTLYAYLENLLRVGRTADSKGARRRPKA